MHPQLFERGWGVAGVGAPSANLFLGRLGLSRFLWVWGLLGPISLLGLPLVQGGVGLLLTPRYSTCQGRASFGWPCPQVAWCLVCPLGLPGRWSPSWPSWWSRRRRREVWQARSVAAAVERWRRAAGPGRVWQEEVRVCVASLSRGARRRRPLPTHTCAPRTWRSDQLPPTRPCRSSHLDTPPLVPVQQHHTPLSSAKISCIPSETGGVAASILRSPPTQHPGPPSAQTSCCPPAHPPAAPDPAQASAAMPATSVRDHAGAPLDILSLSESTPSTNHALSARRGCSSARAAMHSRAAVQSGSAKRRGEGENRSRAAKHRNATTPQTRRRARAAPP